MVTTNLAELEKNHLSLTQQTIIVAVCNVNWGEPLTSHQPK